MKPFNSELLHYLKQITEEEKLILDGAQKVDKDIYSDETDFVIDNKKITKNRTVISIRPHTRFIDFPTHKHNYIEVVYVCQGKITHIIDGNEIILKEGELLFLNQHSKHSIKKASIDDIAVNFIILPEFFDVAFSIMNKNNVIAEFLVGTLRQDTNKGEYLLLKVSEILPIQNLIENMCYSLINNKLSDEYSNQITMGLLFTYLAPNINAIENVKKKKFKEILVDAVVTYIYTNYKNATLTEISNELRQSIPYLSRLVKKETDRTFTDLLQSRRFYRAIELLEETDLAINDIIYTVGYENSSYFYRRFKEKYNITPNEYRVKNKKECK